MSGELQQNKPLPHALSLYVWYVYLQYTHTQQYTVGMFLLSNKFDKNHIFKKNSLPSIQSASRKLKDGTWRNYPCWVRNFPSGASASRDAALEQRGHRRPRRSVSVSRSGGSRRQPPHLPGELGGLRRSFSSAASIAELRIHLCGHRQAGGHRQDGSRFCRSETEKHCCKRERARERARGEGGGGERKREGEKKRVQIKMYVYYDILAILSQM